MSKEKFFVASQNNLGDYLSRNASTLEEIAKENIDRPYNKGLTEEKLIDILNMHSMKKRYEKIQVKFKDIYQFDAKDFLLMDNKISGRLVAYFDSSGKKIYFDGMIENSYFSIFLIIFIWSNHYEEKTRFSDYFKYLTTALYAIIKDEQVANVQKFKYIEEDFYNNEQILNISTSCVVFSLYFNLAHELAHAMFSEKPEYLNQVVSERYKDSSEKNEELMADLIAYDVTLRLMIDEKNSEEKNKELSEFAYLSPLMLFDIYELLDEVSRAINGKGYSAYHDHPEIKERKEILLKLPYEDRYDFDSTDGNVIYNFFLDAKELYLEILNNNIKNGMFSKLIQWIGEF